jgi:hypothetical protein
MRGVDHCWYIEYVPTMIYTTHVCIRCTNNDIHHACVCSMYQQWSTPRMYVFDAHAWCRSLLVHRTYICVVYIIVGTSNIHMRGVDHCWYIEHTHAWYVFDVPTMIYITHVCIRCTNNDLHHACMYSMYQQWSTSVCRSLSVHQTHTCVV